MEPGNDDFYFMFFICYKTGGAVYSPAMTDFTFMVKVWMCAGGEGACGMGRGAGDGEGC